jgi:hypothetical protein
VDEKRNPKTRATVAQLMTRYFSVLDADTQTVRSYRSKYETHIKPLLGTAQLSRVDVETLDTFYAERLVGGREVTWEEAAYGWPALTVFVWALLAALLATMAARAWQLVRRTTSRELSENHVVTSVRLSRSAIMNTAPRRSVEVLVGFAVALVALAGLAVAGAVTTSRSTHRTPPGCRGWVLRCSPAGGRCRCD